MTDERPDEEFEDWSKERKLSPNLSTTCQLYENRYLTVQEYIGRFRKGSIAVAKAIRTSKKLC